jgi:hypothetical protein
MPIRNFSVVSKARIRILTVNYSQRIVEGVLPDNGKIAVPIWELPLSFRWPQIDEIWTVTRQPGQPWCLGHRVTDPSAILPGELRLDADEITDAQGRKVLVAGDVVDDPTSMHWRGDWGALTPYDANDVVYYSSSPWLAVVSNVGSEPSDANTNWRRLGNPPPAMGTPVSKVVFPLGTITANTPISLTHNLGTLDVVTTVYSITTGETVLADMTYLNANTVQVTFGSNLPAATYRVVIIG